MAVSTTHSPHFTYIFCTIYLISIFLLWTDRQKDRHIFGSEEGLRGRIPKKCSFFVTDRQTDRQTDILFSLSWPIDGGDCSAPTDMYHVKAIWAAFDLYQEQSQGLQSIQPQVGCGWIIHHLESKHNITTRFCRMYSLSALSFKYFPLDTICISIVSAHLSIENISQSFPNTSSLCVFLHCLYQYLSSPFWSRSHLQGQFD